MTESILKNIPNVDTLKSMEKFYPDVKAESVLLVLNYLSLAKKISKAYQQFYEKYNLSEAKFSVLMLLNRADQNQLSPSDIAEQAGITRASVTPLLDGMLEYGLIKRIPDQQDRRRFIIQLTNAGRKKLEDILPFNYQLTEILTHHLNSKDYDSLQKSFVNLESGLIEFRQFSEQMDIQKGKANE